MHRMPSGAWRHDRDIQYWISVYSCVIFVQLKGSVIEITAAGIDCAPRRTAVGET